MNKSILYYDARLLLEIIASLGLVALLGLALYRLNKLKPVQKTVRIAVCMLFACWALATVVNTSLFVYDYLTEQRGFIQQSIQSQREMEQGL